ncbi:SusD/RagB family nutrient-binding outer membrane lipoprotein [Saccharicrinis sp. FJH2]|uniref:SusD/RagB family nutrient-binding outer membrane lipoprotein n=1 Tax=Saccharicrinis sp. FJH65 TaxID=3344659 RepID=UPI0035F417BB
MKILKFTIGIVCALALTTGCTESYIEGYDVSPNDPSVVPEANLLTAAEVALFGNVTGEMARETSVFMQSQAGLKDQSLEEHARYRIFEGDNQNDWESIYTDWLDPACDLIDKAEGINPYYKGIGLILKAWAGAYTSDIWGDIPFSQAIKGLENLNPEYDTQEMVYQQAQNLLSQAITELSKPESANLLLPGSDDLIFEGDAEKWIKLAWTLKARYFNRVSKHYAYSADSVLYCLQFGMTEEADNAMAVFGETANNANQWYAFYVLRPGYMGMGAYLVDRLKANSDPRLPFYCAEDANGNYTPSGIDTRTPVLDASEIGPLFNASAQPVPLVTSFEAKFLEAEAQLRKGSNDLAAQACNDGIKASVLWATGADAPEEFVTAIASLTATDINLETIILNKYDAMFTQLEVWTDWRRTGYPVLTPNPDPLANQNGIPFRYPTCISERNYNSNAIVVNNNYIKPWFAE